MVSLESEGDQMAVAMRSSGLLRTTDRCMNVCKGFEEQESREADVASLKASVVCRECVRRRVVGKEEVQNWTVAQRFVYIGHRSVGPATAAALRTY